MCLFKGMPLSMLSFLFIIVGNLLAQDDGYDTRKILEDLRQDQLEIKRDLSEIKALLSKMPTLPLISQRPPLNVKDVDFDLGNNHILGQDDAKLILVEFTDYECQFCSRYVKETFPQIQKAYVDKGIIKYAVVDQPLAIHPNAERASQAAHCAAEQGKFWEIHKLMMMRQDSLRDLYSYARTLGLNISEFKDCVETEKYSANVAHNKSLAMKLGINAVPCFIIGIADQHNPGIVKGISSIRGALPFSIFQQEIDAALNAND